MMRRSLFILLLVCCAQPASAGMTISPGTPAHTHADANTGGNITVGATLASTKVCQTGYTRQTPNYCSKDSQVFGSVNNTCHTIAAPASDAKMVKLAIALSVHSNNAVGDRSTTVRAYNASCVIAADGAALQIREFVATTAANIIAYSEVPLWAAVSSGNIFLLESSVPASGVASFAIVGYMD